MYKRLWFILVMLVISGVYGLRTANADTLTDSSLNRTYSVQMTYVVKDNYKNRLVNSKAAFDELQNFFDTVDMHPHVTYSFLFDVLHGSLSPQKGYVNTE